jgi:hypothetical protein
MPWGAHRTHQKAICGFVAYEPFGDWVPLQRPPQGVRDYGQVTQRRRAVANFLVTAWPAPRPDAVEEVRVVVILSNVHLPCL